MRISDCSSDVCSSDLITSRESVALLRTVTAEAARFPELGRAFFETGPPCWAGSFEDYLRAHDARGRLRIPDPTLAAKFLVSSLKDPLPLRPLLGVQEPEERRVGPECVTTCGPQSCPNTHN